MSDLIFSVDVRVPSYEIAWRAINQSELTTTEIAGFRAVRVVELGPCGVLGVHTHTVSSGKTMQDKSLCLHWPYS